MFHIVLFNPEIPPNTGAIIRLCANCGARLHLIHPLGFSMDSKALKRAGLDYRDLASVKEYTNLPQFLETVQPKRIFACSTKGTSNYADNHYQSGDCFLFGPESRGLPDEVRHSDWVTEVVRLPMLANSRSLNLANTVGIVAYEAWRQVGFSGAA
jgi:tRNA (cytidine/uridine-2'-O-)-methyltransferase